MTVESFPAVDGIETVSPAFLRGLADVVERLGWTQEHADALAGVISLESKFNPAAVNPIAPHATGLIQWIPSEAVKLGTTTAELATMTAEEQLPYVAAYLESRKHVAPQDVSLSIFLPIAIGKADDHVVSRKGEKIYDSNPGLDRSGDGTLTAGEVRAVYAGPLFKARDKPRIPVPPAPKIWPWVLGGLVVLAGGYLAWVESSGQKWDQPIRALLSNPRDVDIRRNPTREAWRAVRRSRVCTTERDARRKEAAQFAKAAHKWADEECEAALGELRSQARAEREERKRRAARASPAFRAAQSRRRRDQIEHRSERVEREANALVYHLEQHTQIPGPAIEQAKRDFIADPKPFFDRAKRSGGRTQPYEFAAEEAEENVSELLFRAQQHADDELDEDEPPF